MINYEQTALLQSLAMYLVILSLVLMLMSLVAAVVVGEEVASVPVVMEKQKLLPKLLLDCL